MSDAASRGQTSNNRLQRSRKAAASRLRVLQLTMSGSMIATLASRNPKVHPAASGAMLGAACVMMLVRLFTGIVS